MNSLSSSWGCPIRGSSDQCLLPAPRSVSPVSAPFFASGCLGLHREPSFIWPFFVFINFFKFIKGNYWKSFINFKSKNRKFNNFRQELQLNWTFNRGVEVSGFEPLTSALQRQRSTNWAIPPLFSLFYFENENFQNQTNRLCSEPKQKKWAMLDLNQRPHPYQGCALPLS